MCTRGSPGVLPVFACVYVLCSIDFDTTTPVSTAAREICKASTSAL